MALLTVLKDGRLKIHRDLSKWRTRVVGKKHALYYDVHPSAAERAANDEVQALIRKTLKEPSEATETRLAKLEIHTQETCIA